MDCGETSDKHEMLKRFGFVLFFVLSKASMCLEIGVGQLVGLELFWIGPQLSGQLKKKKILKQIYL